MIYTRYGNPSQWSVQEKLSALENAESSIVFSSGMAAISSTLLAILDKGSHVVSSRDIYGGTYNFLYEDLDRYGMSVTFTSPTDIDEIERANAHPAGASPFGRDQYVNKFQMLTNEILVPSESKRFLSKSRLDSKAKP